MRALLVSTLALAAVSVASPALADCAGPFDCFCTWSSSTTPNVVAVVKAIDRNDDVTTVTLQIESVHGASPAAVQGGDTLTAELWQDLDEGDRVVAELEDASLIVAYNLVRERDDGSVECSGFSSDDLTLSDILAVRAAEDCYTALAETQARFESPPCNDVVVSPFGCTSTPGPQSAGWLAVLGAGFGWLRRRRAVARRTPLG